MRPKVGDIWHFIDNDGRIYTENVTKMDHNTYYFTDENGRLKQCAFSTFDALYAHKRMVCIFSKGTKVQDDLEELLK